MAELIRRKSLDLDPEYPPGNAFSIDLPNPRLIPQAPAAQQPAFPTGFDMLSDAPKFMTPPSLGIPQRIGTPVQPPPQMRPAPRPTQMQAQELQRIAPIARPPVVAQPVARPVQQRPAARQQPAQQQAAPFVMPTSGPSLQAFQAGSPQALAIRQQMNNGYVPQAGSGLISSSNGNAYAIRPPTPQALGPIQQQGFQDPGLQDEGNYSPQSLLSLLAGQAVRQMYNNNVMRQQKFALSQQAEADRQKKDAAKIGIDTARLGIDQQNANTNAARLDQERYQIFNEEVPSEDGLSTVKIPMRLNAKTGEVSPVRQRKGPSYEEFDAELSKNPAAKGLTPAQKRAYWERTYGK